VPFEIEAVEFGFFKACRAVFICRNCGLTRGKSQPIDCEAHSWLSYSQGSQVFPESNALKQPDGSTSRLRGLLFQKNVSDGEIQNSLEAI
jgi:hypothetical protein